MRHKLLLLCTAFVLIMFADVLAIKSTRRRTGGSSWGSRGSWGSNSKYTTPRSSYPQPSSQHQSHASGGSSPDKIGWNVADKKPAGSNTPVRASAPVNEQSSKTSATNVQSSYNPSGGYPRQPASNPYNPAGQAYPGQGGYNAPVGQGYNAPVGHGGYNAPVGHGGYNAPVGHGGYNAPVGHGYNGPVGPGYNGPVGTSYNGPVGAGYNPGVGHSPYGGQPSYGGHSPYGGQPSYGGPVGGVGQPSYGSAFGSVAPSPQQTILLQQSSRPGIGQLAKEAFVFAGVSAGVNAAVNRIIPGGIYGTRGSSEGSHSGGAPGQPATHTEITYNNYYNNGTAPVAAAPGAAPAAPAGQPAPQPSAQPAADAPQTQQNNPGTNNSPPANSNSPDSTQNNPNPLGFVTSNDDLKRLTESLYQKEKDNNAFSQITMKLQGQKKDESTTDDASEPLLDVKAEAYDLPTVKAVIALHDNYELDVKTKETVTPEERREESELLDKIAETDIIKSTMKFLADKGYIPDDEYEFKDSMKRIWFSQFKRIDGDASSSGFETVFLAEKFDTDILGLHNWIYYAKQEAAGKLNYLGYLKEAKLGDKGAILKLRSSLDGIVQPVSTVFVGTSPELEFALYTMCFFTRPNNPCPVSLGGTEFTIFVSRINYFGKDILISAYPDV
ncbi:uncharacterized protein LOC143365799 isoform X3 [Halictus rubicundus]|uniref:uncharacterized protein LOC143365799 isoform X3 n=1 Tax=Halictus rubicundus TaxID=77578 RepID=UPI0040358A43